MPLLYCAGCSRSIGLVRGPLSYTCPCGATVFLGENNDSALPVSLILSLSNGSQIPHVDYYVGKSSCTSERKEELVKLLKSRGSTWSWECDSCREKTVERAVYEVREGLYTFKLHPELERLVALYMVVNG